MSQRYFPIRVIAFLMAILLCLSNAWAEEVSFEEGSYEEMLHLNHQMFELYTNPGKHASDKDAIPLAKRALELAEKFDFNVPGVPNSSYIANPLLALGELYRMDRTSDSNAKALPLVQRALDIYEEAFGPDNSRTLTALYSLAALYDAIGDHAKAIELRLRAHPRSNTERIKEVSSSMDSMITADWPTLQNPGARATIKENIKADIPFFQSRYERFEKGVGPNTPYAVSMLFQMAVRYFVADDYDQAESLFLKVLAIREKTLGPHDLDIVRTLNHLGVLYSATGEYAKAKPFLLRALNISWEPLVTTYTTATYAESKLRAVEIYENVFGPDHLATALALDDLAEFYRITGDYARAEPLYARALKIHEKALGSNLLMVTTSFKGLIKLYHVTGTDDKAESLYLRTLEIIEKERESPNHPDILSSLDNLAEFYYTTGAHAKASSIYQRALAIREKVLGPDHPDILGSLRNLALLYYAMKDYAQAVPLLERAQQIEEDNTVRLLRFAKESDKQAYMQQREENVDINISFSLATTAPRAKALGLTDVLQYKGRVLNASSTYLKVRIRDSMGNIPNFSPRADVVQKFSAMLFRGPGEFSIMQYQDRLEHLAQQQEDWGAEEFEVSPIKLEQVRRRLPADGVLVEWLRYRPFDPRATKESARWGAPRYVAYVLKPAGDVVAFDLGAAQPIDALVMKFREALNNKDVASYEHVKDVARNLFDQLIAPLYMHLAQSKKLLLSPDGALNLVPFAALLGKDNQYLVQRYEITYLNSGSDLASMHSGFARDYPVVVADPEFGAATSGKVAVASNLKASGAPELDPSSLMFPQLPGAKVEGKELQSLLNLNERHFLTGTKATETRLRELHGPSILHLATHGFFFPDEVMAKGANNPVKTDRQSLALSLAKNPLLRSVLALAGADHTSCAAKSCTVSLEVLSEA